jgi:DNA polymerase-3 subunit beta
MKVLIDAKTLAAQVTWVAKTLSGRPALPILTGVLLQAADEHLRMTCYDYDTCARTTLGPDDGAQVQQDGQVLVPGRLLADIVAKMPVGELQLVVEDGASGPALSVSGGRSTFRLLALPLEDYPTVPAWPTPAGTVDSAEFAYAVAATAVAATKDPTVPALTCINVELGTDGGKDQILLAATDRYRFPIATLPWQPAPSPADTDNGDSHVGLSLLVNAGVLASAAKALATDSPHLHLAVSDAASGQRQLLGLAAGSRQVIARLMEEQAIDHRKLFPTAFTHHARIATRELTAALRRVAVVAERNTPVRLTFTPADADAGQGDDGGQGRVLLETSWGDQATASELVAVDWDGHDTPFEIAFSPSYLQQALGALRTPYARLSFTTPTRPALIQPDPGPDNDGTGGQVGGYRHLLMPVRLV